MFSTKPLTSTLIYAPEGGRQYSLQSNWSQHPAVTASLVGFNINYLIHFDFCNLTGFTRDLQNRSVKTHNHWLVPEDALPFSIFEQPRSPLIFYNTIDKNKLDGISELRINVNNSSMRFATLQTFQVEVINETLARQCRYELDWIKLTICNFPIFSEKHYPSFTTLNNLFNQFVEYNSREKLDWQYSNSANRCPIRAHFSSTFLNHYRIASVKIYKLWNKGDWQPYHQTRSWAYHCASLLIDDQNRKWVWDPWVTCNKSLVSMKEWVYRQDEPRPICVGIANRSFIYFKTPRDMPAGQNFLQTANKHDFNSFQALCVDALPNPPERPLLFSEGLSLFSNKKSIEKKKIVKRHTSTRSEEKEESHKRQRI